MSIIVNNKTYTKPAFIDGRSMNTGADTNIGLDNSFNLELWLNKYMGVYRDGTDESSTVNVSAPITGDGSLSNPLTLSASGVTPGAYTGFTVNQYGLITAAALLTDTDLIGILGYTPLLVVDKQPPEPVPL